MKRFMVGIVGPCAAGKSTLVSALRKMGIKCKHIAQEHSYVQDMWKRLTDPDILIYLDVSYRKSMERRKSNMTYMEFERQVQRLEHARQNADLFINTDHLTIQDVQTQVVNFIKLKM